jgi:hypothetical protein
MKFKATRPVIGNGPLKKSGSWPGSQETNIPSATRLQAPSLPPDDAGEDDATFFRRRPSLDRRKRLAFEGEPPPGLQEPNNVAFISVRLVRDAAGQPAKIMRAIVYGEWGTA